MRTFGVVQVLLFLILLLAYQCSQAQDYMVNTRGDTLRGKVRMFNHGPDKKVQLSTPEKKKVIVPLIQVKAVYSDGELFQPMKGPNGYTFMKLLHGGFLSLYGYQQENQTAYDGLYLYKLDGSGVDVPNLSFKKVMKNFLDDCPAISEKVADGDYSRKNISALIDAYNQCMSAQSEGSVKVEETVKKVQPERADNPAWQALEEKVNAHSDFPTKSDALDMIAEIRSKISRAERVPNFLIDGLKNSLKETGLDVELDKALKEIK